MLGNLWEQADRAQYNRVMNYIRAGKDEGARLITGGERVGHKGLYIQPTIFADVQVDLHCPSFIA